MCVCCPFPQEMSLKGSLTKLSQFLTVSLPTQINLDSNRPNTWQVSVRKPAPLTDLIHSRSSWAQLKDAANSAHEFITWPFMLCVCLFLFNLKRVFQEQRLNSKRETKAILRSFEVVAAQATLVTLTLLSDENKRNTYCKFKSARKSR